MTAQSGVGGYDVDIRLERNDSWSPCQPDTSHQISTRSDLRFDGTVTAIIFDIPTGEF